MAKIIFESQLEDFLEELSESFRVIVPVIEHEHSSYSKVNFKKYEKGDYLAFSYPTTNLPPKEFLLPPKDILFSFDKTEAKIPKAVKTIIFGLSLEDLEGIDSLKKIFTKPVEDEVFLKKAENTFLVGIDQYSPPKEVAFDLYLQKVKADSYAVFAKSTFGRKLTKSRYFESHRLRVPKVIQKKDPLIWDPDLPKIIEKSKNHRVWQELAEICFGCGICSYVCPLCYCFETEDEIDFPIKEKLSGKRCRTWDSCMLPHFAEISNHNFRDALSERIYNWYFHKFVRMPREYNFPGCVDCKRCTIFCPAKINYRIVLERLINDFKAKKR